MGQEGLQQMASQFQSMNAAAAASGAAGADDDDVPDLVENFEEAAKI